MRSVRFERPGDPAEVLRVVELPDPQPGAGEVLVRMRVRSINPSDLLMIRQRYPGAGELPATPGLEGMGTVEGVGAGVTAVRPGQRVIPTGVVGTWQEYLVADPARLIPVPDTVSDATAAQFVVNPLTAWVMLTDVLDLRPGQWLLQTAAGSTLGRVVLQIAAIRGFRTLCVVRRRDQVDELRSLGADAVVCTGDEELPARVRELTGGEGVPAAIEAVGGKTATQAVQSLADGGRMLVYGLLSGEPFSIHSGEMIFRDITVQGFWLANWFRQTPVAQQQAAIATLMGHMSEGKIVPPVEAEYDLAEVAAAVRHAQTPGRHGKVLLTG
jgi:NADPH2:quinone reductase